MPEAPTGHPYDALTPDMVLDAVDSKGYLTDARIIALNSYENRVYHVGIEDQPALVVKFYRPDRWSREQILEEHQFSHELMAQELPIVAPLEFDGETLHEHKGFEFALFPARGGHPPELDNLDHMLILGRLMGRIHRIGATTSFEHRPAINSETYADQSVAFLLENDFIPQALLEAYETLTRDLLKRVHEIEQQYNVASIRLHGDCHIGNILWRQDNPNFVDFDDCRSGPAVQDLWMFLSGDRRNQTMVLSELMEGYSEFCEFNPVELNLVEYLRTLRIIHYSAWLARRWTDPAFPMAFPWFNTERYWADHILELREQLAALDEPPLVLY